MIEEPKRFTKYHDELIHQLSEIDDLSVVVLKCHLVIESALDFIISLIFFHPRYILEGRFNFVQKVNVARSYCLRQDIEFVWSGLLAINTLRNEIAHNLSGSRRQRKMKELRALFLVNSSIEYIAFYETASEAHIVQGISAECLALLSAFEEDLKAVKRKITLGDRG
jgi:hypothetical protein